MGLKEWICPVETSTVPDGSKDPFNPLNQMIIQMACILVMSHFFHLILKPLGQSGPFSQILAGIVLSPALLSRVPEIKMFFLQTSSATYYGFFAFLFRTAFMFLIGLETDARFLKNNFKKASVIACGSIISSFILGLAFCWLIMHELKVESHKFIFVLVYLIVLANSACPVVCRVVADMKLDTSDIGRLAISSSLIIEMSCISLYSLVYAFTTKENFGGDISVIASTIILIIAFRYLAPWFNTWNPNEKYLSKSQILVFIVLTTVASSAIETAGYNCALPMFLLGIFFPRKGKAYRTLLQGLTFPIHEFILPVYFGYIGFRFNISISDRHDFLVFVLTILLSFLGKILGVFCACFTQNIPRDETVFLSTILTMKGHVALLLLDANVDFKDWWSPKVHDLFLSAIVVITLVSGFLTSFVIKSEERSFAHTQTALERHKVENELRTLSCVYGPRHTSVAISLISALSGSRSQAPFTPILMHLVELPKKRKSNLMYHQLEDGEQFSDEEDFGRNDTLEINESIDSFALDSKVVIHQKKVVSTLSSMYEDVCNGAEDLRVSIILLPFHKYQRIDGKTANDNEGIRATNQKILRHAPCSVGIFVDRNLTGFQSPHVCDTVQHVATLFFGGPDDREALALSRWITLHPQLHSTIIRFIPESAAGGTATIGFSTQDNNEVLMSISTNESENEKDTRFMDDFYNSYVTSGQVGYIEKYVNNGAQTLSILREIKDVYSLFVVGKGRGDSPMTTGMSDWEECAELGTVGDLLASSDLDINASVLVIQKHRHSNGNPLDD